MASDPQWIYIDLGETKITVDFAAQSARYIKVVQTGSASNWWSIREFTVNN
jgi:hypothetical protein